MAIPAFAPGTPNFLKSTESRTVLRSLPSLEKTEIEWRYIMFAAMTVPNPDAVTDFGEYGPTMRATLRKVRLSLAGTSTCVAAFVEECADAVGVDEAGEVGAGEVGAPDPLTPTDELGKPPGVAAPPARSESAAAFDS
ncbi:MAG: hypothetical protein WCJ22_00985 [Actinomycetes bacterium]